MKRMIISPAQLKAINEAAITNTCTYDTSKGEGLNDALANVQSNTTEPIAVVDTNPDKNINNGTSTILGGVENAKKEQTKPSTRTTLIMPGQLEETRYSKRQVELGRMLEMRRTGKVFSKKQLNEIFMETQENAKRLRDGIGDCDIFQVIDAVDEFFPEESENFKEALHNGADLTEYICSIFSNGKVNADKEEEFLESLGL